MLDPDAGAGDPRRRPCGWRRRRLPQRRHRRVPRTTRTTGSFSFLEVNTRLQVEHPVTEATTGLDLVKLQLHVARRRPARRASRRRARARHRGAAERRGPRARTSPPRPGRIALLRLPAGRGIRVDTGVGEGDTIPADFDSMIAKIIAWGRDRDEALARLRRALAETTVVIEGGTTNRSFLLDPARPAGGARGRLRQPAGWTGCTARASTCPRPSRWRCWPPRSRPTTPTRPPSGPPSTPAPRAAGPSRRPRSATAAELRYRGAAYDLRVYRTGAGTYRVTSGGAVADVVRRPRRRSSGGVVAVAGCTAWSWSGTGAMLRIDVDGAAHRGVPRRRRRRARRRAGVRAVGARRSPETEVAEGDPLAVLESMKMENTITAPFARHGRRGRGRGERQVEAGAPIVRIATRASMAAARPAPSTSPAWPAEPPVAPSPASGCTTRCAATCSATTSTPARCRRLLGTQRELGQTAAPADTDLMRCEDGLLDLFADVGALYRPRGEVEPEMALLTGQHAGVPAVLPAVAGRGSGGTARTRTAERLERALRATACADWTARPNSRTRSSGCSALSAGSPSSCRWSPPILERRLRHRDTAGAAGRRRDAGPA